MIPTFTDHSLLEEALTHTSWGSSYENGGTHNERLEFLGDAVLQLFSTELLFQRFFQVNEKGTLRRPSDPPGEYRTPGRNRAHMEARRDGETRKGEEATGGRDKDRLLAGLFEAVLGAIYLDGASQLLRRPSRTSCAKISTPSDTGGPEVEPPRMVPARTQDTAKLRGHGRTRSAA